MQYFGSELKAQETGNLDKVTSDFSRKREPYTTSGLFAHSRNKRYSFVYCSGDHFSSRCDKVTNCQLFYVSMEGVLSVWTMGTLQKIVRLNMCANDVRRVNVMFRYVRLIP